MTEIIPQTSYQMRDYKEPFIDHHIEYKFTSRFTFESSKNVEYVHYKFCYAICRLDELRPRCSYSSLSFKQEKTRLTDTEGSGKPAHTHTPHKGTKNEKGQKTIHQCATNLSEA